MSDEDEVTRIDAGGSVEKQTIQAINKSQFREEIRRLVDVAAKSGIEADELQEVLDDLSTGVPYYYEDIERYSSDGEGQ